MAKDISAQIAEYKSRIESLERDLFADLALLPAQYGFATAEEFIVAVRKSVGAQPVSKALAPSLPMKRNAKAGRRTRAKITPEILAQVKALAEAGKTGKEIAKATGISIPSVQNLKKKLGLVAKRAAKKA